jgi:hypothetical protein
MWVFIRPGVVRSANEMKGKLAQQFCPIHRFDGIYQVPSLLQKERQREKRCVAYVRRVCCVSVRGQHVSEAEHERL